MDPERPPLIRVALDAPLDRLFDYRAADATPADIGRRVRVPFGRREQVGVVVGLAERAEVADAQLRDALAIDRDLPALPADILALARFAAGYYQHPLGPTLLALLPPALKRQRFRAPAPAAYALTEAGRVRAGALPARAHAQRRLAERLAAGPVAAADLAGLRAPLADWLKQGWATPAAQPETAGPAGPAPEPTPGQAAALAAVRGHDPGFAAWLLHGVTGSGKTEVYLRLIEDVLAKGSRYDYLLSLSGPQVFLQT